MPEELRPLVVGAPRPDGWPDTIYLMPRTGLERMKIRKAFVAGDDEKALVMSCCMRARNAEGTQIWYSELDKIMQSGDIAPFIRLGVAINESDKEREEAWLNR